ncbi:hypothetical protein FHT92_000032 [Rhizobium sp. BK377]|nr:hypothetical protein [Rhizobium sp. BK377]
MHLINFSSNRKTPGEVEIGMSFFRFCAIFDKNTTLFTFFFIKATWKRGQTALRG